MALLFLCCMQPIGIFDSGYGGLTVMKEIVNTLPQYDYVYLGDNARAPYGPRDFDTVYKYTWQAVQWFFERGCPLVILACNTASAKALRTIQQNHLAQQYPEKRVLGVIRPTSEVIGQYTQTGHIGILGTTGTVQSGSYLLEIKKFFPDLKVCQEACPMWVPLVESGDANSEGAGFFIKENLEHILAADAEIDTLLLACTHYPLLEHRIRAYLPNKIKIVSQGDIVAHSLADYLNRHPEIADQCSKNGSKLFYTTGDIHDFNSHGSDFFGQIISSEKVSLI